jgi:hypothetical protein
MKRQPFLGRAAYLDVMTNLVRRETTRFVPDAFSLTLVTLANEESELADDWAGLTQEWLKVELAEYEDLPPVSYLSMFVNAADEFGAQTVLARAVEIGQFLEHAYVPLDEPLLVSRILEVLDELKLSEVHASVRASVIDAFQDDLKGMIAANDVLGRYGDADDLEDAQSAVEKYIRNSLGDLGVDADTYEVREIASEFDVQEAVRENQEIAMREEYDAERWEGRGAEDADSSRAVDDLFERDSP